MKIIISNSSSSSSSRVHRPGRPTSFHHLRCINVISSGAESTKTASQRTIAKTQRTSSHFDLRLFLCVEALDRHLPSQPAPKRTATFSASTSAGTSCIADRVLVFSSFKHEGIRTLLIPTPARRRPIWVPDISSRTRRRSGAVWPTCTVTATMVQRNVMGMAVMTLGPRGGPSRLRSSRIHTRLGRLRLVLLLVSRRMSRSSITVRHMPTTITTQREAGQDALLGRDRANVVEFATQPLHMARCETHRAHLYRCHCLSPSHTTPPAASQGCRTGIIIMRTSMDTGTSLFPATRRVGAILLACKMAIMRCARVRAAWRGR